MKRNLSRQVKLPANDVILFLGPWIEKQYL